MPQFLTYFGGTVKFYKWLKSSGKRMNRYKEALKNTPVPVMPSQISGRKFDLSGLLKYAKEKNISPAKLSEKEKSEFIH